MATIAGVMVMEPMTLGELVRQRRKERGWTQEDLEGHSGISQTHISQIESGKTKMPTDATLYALSESLAIPMRTLRELAGYIIIEEVRPEDIDYATVEVLDLGIVPADEVRWAEGIERGVMTEVPSMFVGPRKPESLFILHASGDCLASRGIVSGSTVLCEWANGRKPQDGQIVAVRIATDRTLKIWRQHGGVIELVDGEGRVVATVTEQDDIEVAGFFVAAWIRAV